MGNQASLGLVYDSPLGGVGWLSAMIAIDSSEGADKILIPLGLFQIIANKQVTSVAHPADGLPPLFQVFSTVLSLDHLRG